MNSPIPSLLLPLWQNESLCETIGMKIWCHLYSHLHEHQVILMIFMGNVCTRLQVVPLSLSSSCVTQKKKLWPREKPGGEKHFSPSGSRAAIFCHARRTKRITHDGLSERGTTRSLVLHKHSLCKWKLRRWKSKSAYTLFCFIRMLFFRPRLNILIFLPILGW